MNTPPLAIIQARLGSRRLPGKVLMEVGGRSLVRRAYDAAVSAFGRDHVVITVPAKDTKLIDHIWEFGGVVEPWDGDENDVLARFWTVAHKYRWHPDSVIVRITPDDPFKQPARLLRVAKGERLDVERSGEAFTLAQLDEWGGESRFSAAGPPIVEHLSVLIPGEAPPCPRGRGWTVDTADDLNAARELAEKLDAEKKRAGFWRVVPFAHGEDYVSLHGIRP